MQDQINKIHTAATLGKTEEIQKLLRKNPELLNARDTCGNTPFAGMTFMG